ncbi:MAG TPA: sugar ABC transporter permease [Clostridiaceae bacterium]|nr:sugar ABC transporter permease [Clostridiaceae bacterium]
MASGSKHSYIRKKKFNFKKDMIGWAIMLPGLVLFTFFVWKPLLSGIILSFFETEGFHAGKFIGFGNYIEALTDMNFKKALLNCFKYTFWTLLLTYLLPPFMAIIINEMVHFRGYFRFSIYFPSMVPSVAVSILWLFLFDPGPNGFLNILLSYLNIEPSGWLQNPKLTIPLIVLTMAWRNFGPTSVIYIAALQGINNDLYGVAAIDGAGFLAKIRHITLPGIYNIMRLFLAVQVIVVFQVLQEPLVLTGGGPDNASTSLMLQIYHFAFRDFQAGKAIATSVIAFIILMSLTLVYFKLVKANTDME